MNNAKRKNIITAIICVLAVAVVAVVIVFFLSRPKKRLILPDKGEKQDIDIEFTATDHTGERIKIFENSTKIMYFEQVSSSVTIEDKASGEVWNTVPADAFDDLKITSNAIKPQLYSPVLIDYYSIEKKQMFTDYTSYENSTSLDQVLYAKIDNGVRVQMILGNPMGAMLIPEELTAEEMDRLSKLIEENVSSFAAKRFKYAFIHYVYLDESGKQVASAREIALHPKLRELNEIYHFKEDSTQNTRNEVEGYLRAIGYTYEEIFAQYEILEYTSKAAALPSFKLYIDYVLEGDKLKVKLDVENIDYDRKEFILAKIKVLPYFDAAKYEDEGYMFFPDGSGALVAFNDGTVRTQLTTERMYGQDPAEDMSNRANQKNYFAYPVCGMKKNNRGYLMVVTQGDAVSEMNCTLGNITHSYNSVYPSFTIRQGSKYDAGGLVGQAAWIQYDKTGYTGNIELDYYLMVGDNDYNAMAKIYRDHLLKAGVLKENNVAQGTSLMIDTYGVLKNYVRVLGIPTYKNVEVTSYKEAADMLNELKEAGVENIGLRYKSWLGGGYYTYALSKFEMEGAVGSKKDLKNLENTAKELGAELFMDTDFTLVGAVRRVDFSFIPSKDSIRNLFQNSTYYKVVDTAAGTMFDWYMAVNPSVMLSYYDKFTKGYNKLGLSNISLGKTGAILASNYNNKDYVNRQSSEETIKELLNRADQKYEKVLVDTGNAYTLGYTDYIMNLPNDNSGLKIEMESVPFIQMVLSGSITYAATPINYGDDIQKEALKCIEYGSQPYFAICDTDKSVVKNYGGGETKFYSCLYEDWKDDMIKVYKTVSDALSAVGNARMTSHEKLSDNVYVSYYSNGTEIYVNYGDKDYSYEGLTIPANNYKVKGGKN